VTGDTVKVTGTFDDDVLTGIGEESVLFGSDNDTNTLQIAIPPFIFDETDDRRYPDGEFPVLRFLNGSLVSFDFFKIPGLPGFRSVSDVFESADFLSGTWDYDLSFKMSPVDNDDDGDGVLNDDDLCPDNTQVPENVVPTVRLNPNHWALIDDDYVFDTLIKGKGKGPNRSYTIEDTRGCSCEQIIYMQGLGAGHTKFGCSISAMDDWVELVNP
jgi:hypothetical protein